VTLGVDILVIERDDLVAGDDDGLRLGLGVRHRVNEPLRRTRSAGWTFRPPQDAEKSVKIAVPAEAITCNNMVFLIIMRPLYSGIHSRKLRFPPPFELSDASP